MSAEGDPFERVWFNRQNPETAHSTERCAGERHGPAIPSFAAFVDEDDRCGTCMVERDPRAPEVPEDVPVGEELREVRGVLKLTQGEVADRLGLADGSAVGSWENGQRQPNSVRWGELRDLAAEADALQEDGATGDGEIETDGPQATDEGEVVCETCGDTFGTVQGLSAHKRHSVDCTCETCDGLESHTTEWYVHRTEDHGLSYAHFGYLEAGEFEAIVAEAGSVTEICDELGWTTQRVCRVLNAYGLSDAVGRGNETPDGDDSWREHYDRADVSLNGGESA